MHLAGQLYVDGSCTTEIFPELRRAASSVVVRPIGGEVEARILIPLWRSLPQAPQAAEYVGLAVPFQHLSGVANVASDCSNSVRDFQRPFDVAMMPTRRYAGIVRDSWAQPSRRDATVTKVKAHKTWAGMAEGEEKCNAIGNDEADVAAKMAVFLHDPPPPAEVTQLEADCRRASLAIRTIAATMGTFPPMPRERMVRRPVAREGAAITGDGGHQWAYEHGFWRCVRCLKCTAKSDIPAALVHSVCEGPKTSLMLSVVAEKGHNVACTGDCFRVVFSTVCGAFSWRRAYGLGASCPRRATPAGEQALARIRRGQAPWQVRTEAGVVRPSIGWTSMVWRSLDHEPVWVAGDGMYRRKRGLPHPALGASSREKDDGRVDRNDDVADDEVHSHHGDGDAGADTACHGADKSDGPSSKRSRCADAVTDAAAIARLACRPSTGSCRTQAADDQVLSVSGAGPPAASVDVDIALAEITEAHAGDAVGKWHLHTKRPAIEGVGDSSRCVKKRVDRPLYSVGGSSSSHEALPRGSASTAVAHEHHGVESGRKGRGTWDSAAERPPDATSRCVDDARIFCAADAKRCMAAPASDPRAEDEKVEGSGGVDRCVGGRACAASLEAPPNPPREQPHRLRADHGLDPREGLRGCHSLDGGHELRESTELGPRRRLCRDDSDGLGASSRSALHQRGPPVAGGTAGPEGSHSVVSDFVHGVDMALDVGSLKCDLNDAQPASSGADSGPRGARRCDAPHRRDLPQHLQGFSLRRDAAQRAPCRAAHCRDVPLDAQSRPPGQHYSLPAPPALGCGSQPGELDAADVGVEARDDCSNERCYKPWGGQPAWLYLPHLGIGCGSEFVEDANGNKRRRLDMPSSARATKDVPTELRESVSSGIHERRAASSSTRCGTGGDQIRGLAHQPGNPRARGPAAASSRDIRLATQRAAIQRSLDDHAERVARKRQQVADLPPTPTAAERLEAIRRRVASRLAQPTPRAVAGLDDAAAHAATRDAVHAVASPPADEVR